MWQRQIRMNQLPVGRMARVTYLEGENAIRRRLQDIGLIEGTKIQCLQKSPAGDPTAYEIRGAVIALRGEDAKNIWVECQSGERIWD